MSHYQRISTRLEALETEADDDTQLWATGEMTTEEFTDRASPRWLDLTNMLYWLIWQTGTKEAKVRSDA